MSGQHTDPADQRTDADGMSGQQLDQQPDQQLDQQPDQQLNQQLNQPGQPGHGSTTAIDISAARDLVDAAETGGRVFPTWLRIAGPNRRFVVGVPSPAPDRDSGQLDRGSWRASGLRSVPGLRQLSGLPPGLVVRPPGRWLLRAAGRGRAWLIGPLVQRQGVPWFDIVLGLAVVFASYFLFVRVELPYQEALTQRDRVRRRYRWWRWCCWRRGARWGRRCRSWRCRWFCCASIPRPSAVGSVLDMRNVRLDQFAEQMSLSTNGIYGTPIGVVAQTVFLFVLMGSLLDRAGAGAWFTQLAFAAVGRFRGGPGKAAVLASGFTGLVSGSSIANTVTTGTFTIPMMKKAGYPAVKAGAIEVASSTNGQLMPPIMGAAAFLIAETIGMDYSELILAALIPAVISYIALIWITHLEAAKLDLKPVPRDQIPPFWATFRSGLHYLIPLGFLIWMLMVGRQSAEKSALYAIIALAGLMVVRDQIVGRVNRRRGIGHSATRWSRCSPAWSPAGAT